MKENTQTTPPPGILGNTPLPTSLPLLLAPDGDGSGFYSLYLGRRAIATLYFDSADWLFHLADSASEWKRISGDERTDEVAAAVYVLRAEGYLLSLWEREEEDYLDAVAGHPV